MGYLTIFLDKGGEGLEEYWMGNEANDRDLYVRITGILMAT